MLEKSASVKISKQKSVLIKHYIFNVGNVLEPTFLVFFFNLFYCFNRK